MVETNELTRKLRTLLHPRAALIVYAEENDNHSTDDDGYFIEVRDIDENGTMGEGRPVTAWSENGRTAAGRTGTGLFRKPQCDTIRQDTVQPAVV